MDSNPLVQAEHEDPREGEDRLFTFLAHQAAHFESETWLALVQEPASLDDVAYTVLLLSNLTEQLTPPTPGEPPTR
ncbi:hypothetical protein [Roseateles aquatilis]|uniref:hypothetical protein n=1 Tax=Roseateles aquatilis TaxID=431061 RepID=UPI00113060E7|nr:hypothetical protein [Roseateles aquatilis]